MTIKMIGGVIVFVCAVGALWWLFQYWRSRRAGLKPYRPSSPVPRAGLGQERERPPHDK